MSHLMETYRRLAVSFVRGEGLKLYTKEGEVYWDYLSGLGVNNLGHSHPVVVKTIQEQAARLLHVSNLYRIEEQERLAAQLSEVSGLAKAFFCNSGTEAVEGLIKLARRYQRQVRGEDRFEVITAYRSFHGRTLGALSATGQEKYQRFFEPLVPGFKYVPYNDLAALEETITPQTALVLLEPVQGEGGVYPAEPGYLKQVAELCRERGVLFGLDEVQTGVGRCGSFYAFQRYGAQPDLVSSAKALAGGLPIGVVLASEEVAQGFAPSSHASTFGGNPLVTKVASQVVQIISDSEFLAQVEKTGAYLEEQLLSQAGSAISQIRRLGLMLGIELSSELDAGEVNKALFTEEKILANAIGSHILRVLPPLISTEADCDRFVKAFCRQVL
ncbi:MAG: aspartate aminotransferase family protein [Firmicutes bacterium]|nr:aspartate aminotransferase family protein [Bacillota bacterium]